MLNRADFRSGKDAPKTYKGMIEKINIEDASVVATIQNKLNKKELRDAMFTTWRLTLRSGEEYDLNTALYGMYMIRNGDLGSTGLVLIGAGPSNNLMLNTGSSFSTDFAESGKLVINKKAINGSVFVKNNRPTETIVVIMQITNY